MEYFELNDMKNIPLAKPDIQDIDIQEVVKVLKSGNLVQGKYVKDLENQTKELIQVNNCTAVSSGTASLHIALISLGVGYGDEVILPAFSFIATANVVELIGAKCVFVDINSEYFTLDPFKIEAAVTPKTKAIIVVHEFGLCANMEAISDIANRFGLPIIEDAACALGAKIGNFYAGSFGNIGSFSLHPRKAITSGEGGLLVTNEFDLDTKFKALRNHGIDPNSKTVDFIDAGFNYRMTDFQGALALSQLRRIHDTLLYKDGLAKSYLEKLNKNICLPEVPPNYQHTWQTFHITLNSNRERRLLQEYLSVNGIQTNYGAQCIPAMTYYNKKYKHNSIEDFPNSWRAYSTGLALPIYELLTEIQLNYIINTINKFYNNAV